MGYATPDLFQKLGLKDPAEFRAENGRWSNHARQPDLRRSGKTTEIVVEALARAWKGEKTLIAVNTEQVAREVRKIVGTLSDKLRPRLDKEIQVFPVGLSGNRADPDKLMSLRAFRGIDQSSILFDNSLTTPLMPPVNTPEGFHRHSNGGGLVADSSWVDKSAYVDWDSIVLGNSQVRQSARVSNSIVLDTEMWGESQVTDSTLFVSKLQDQTSVIDSVLRKTQIRHNTTIRSSHVRNTKALDSKIIESHIDTFSMWNSQIEQSCLLAPNHRRTDQRIRLDRSNLLQQLITPSHCRKSRTLHEDSAKEMVKAIKVQNLELLSDSVREQARNTPHPLRDALDATTLPFDLEGLQVKDKNMDIKDALAILDDAKVKRTELDMQGKLLQEREKQLVEREKQLERLEARELEVSNRESRALTKEIQLNDQELRVNPETNRLVEEQRMIVIERDRQIGEISSYANTLQSQISALTSQVSLTNDMLLNLMQGPVRDLMVENQKLKLEKREKQLEERERGVKEMEQEALKILNEEAERLAQDIKDKDKTKMNNQAIKNTMGAGGAAMMNGAQLAAASKLNKMIANAAKKLACKLAGVDPDTIDNPVVDALLKITTPFMLLYACEKFPQQIPAAGTLKAGAEAAITAATFQTLMPILDEITPELDAIRKEAAVFVSENPTDAPQIEKTPASNLINDIINAKTPEHVPS